MKYIIPIGLSLTILCSFLDDPFRLDLTNHVSWSGELGYQNYFHYWYLTNHEIKSLIILSLLAYVCRNQHYVFWFIIVYICYDLYELINYLYYGGLHFTDSEQQNREFYINIGVFITAITLLIKDKWRHQK
jgi:hypothetical protein